jgi:hypothetical protein
LYLQVAGAQPQDVGKATAQLTRSAFQELGMHEGDVIEIIGKRTTAAIALPPYSEDEGLNVIRLNGLQRVNAAVGMGDYVEVRRAEARPARRVVLAPAQKNLRLSGSGEALRRTLYQRPLVAGDVISTSVYCRTPTVERGFVPGKSLPLVLRAARLWAPGDPASGDLDYAAWRCDGGTGYRDRTAAAAHGARGAAPADVAYDDIGGLAEPAVTEYVVNTPLAETDGLEELQSVVSSGD